jgi:hypothetical protein
MFTAFTKRMCEADFSIFIAKGRRAYKTNEWNLRPHLGVWTEEEGPNNLVYVVDDDDDDDDDDGMYFDTFWMIRNIFSARI